MLSTHCISQKLCVCNAYYAYVDEKLRKKNPIEIHAKFLKT